MPVIQMSISKQSKEQKAELIKGLTETASAITGIPQRSFTIMIQEFDTDNIGVGGEPLTELMRSMGK